MLTHVGLTRQPRDAELGMKEARVTFQLCLPSAEQPHLHGRNKHSSAVLRASGTRRPSQDHGAGHWGEQRAPQAVFKMLYYKMQQRVQDSSSPPTQKLSMRPCPFLICPPESTVCGHFSPLRAATKPQQVVEWRWQVARDSQWTAKQ